MVHSFLLIGQSNAAGRGLLSGAEPLDSVDGRLKVLRNGRWHTMYRPVNPDRIMSGTCFAETFAKAYAEAYPDVEVGIIPCADGGTSLSQWQPGEILFDNAVHHARLAMRTSHLVGVLWHQGESDCGEDQYPLYTQRFLTMADALRRALGRPELPFVLGGLGDFLADFTREEQIPRNYRHVNAALQALAQEHEDIAFASAEGLGANTDNLHFNASALAALGYRYFEAFQSLGVTVKPDEPKLTEALSEIELL